MCAHWAESKQSKGKNTNTRKPANRMMSCAYLTLAKSLGQNILKLDNN